MALACRAGIGPVGVDLPEIDRIAEHPPEARPAPAPPSMGGQRPLLLERGNDRAQSRPIFQVAGEDLLDHRVLRRVDLYAAGLAGAVRTHTVPVGRPGPGQQCPCAPFCEPSPPHALRNEGALVFGHCPADLKEQLVVRIVTHGAVKQLFEQQRLMHVLAGEAIWGGDEDALHLRRGNRIAERIQARTT
jgi:hypothetical protein